MKYRLCILLFSFLLKYSLLNAQAPDNLNLEDLTLKAKQKAFELGENISLIGNKDTDKSIKRTLINRTVDMFIDGDRQIEVTSVRDTSLRKKEKIRKYLNRISDLSDYKSVDIKWDQVHIIDKIHKKNDGEYWGTIRIIQRFEGKGSKGEDIYKDITEKELEIKLEKLNIEQGSKLESFYVLKFSDIKVIETKEVKKSGKS